LGLHRQDAEKSYGGASYGSTREDIRGEEEPFRATLPRVRLRVLNSKRRAEKDMAVRQHSSIMVQFRMEQKRERRWPGGKRLEEGI